MECKHQVVMQVQRLASASWNRVHIDADQQTRIWAQQSSGFFYDFALSGVPNGCVARFHVAPGEQPAIKAAVVNQQHGLTHRIEHYTGAGDVAGCEYFSRERLRRPGQQRECQIDALRRLAIRPRVEVLEHSADFADGNHEPIIHRPKSVSPVPGNTVLPKTEFFHPKQVLTS